jgi:hypothetical protein
MNATCDEDVVRTRSMNWINVNEIPVKSFQVRFDAQNVLNLLDDLFISARNSESVI